MVTQRIIMKIITVTIKNRTSTTKTSLIKGITKVLMFLMPIITMVMNKMLIPTIPYNTKQKSWANGEHSFAISMKTLYPIKTITNTQTVPFKILNNFSCSISLSKINIMPSITWEPFKTPMEWSSINTHDLSEPNIKLSTKIYLI